MTTASGAGALRVAVTGAGGLIGSEVTRLLAASGARARVLAGPPGTPVEALPPGIEVHHGWVDDPVVLAAVVGSADVVAHLAGPPSVAASYVEPVAFARAHVVGTATLWQAMAGSPVRRLVHISSAEVYGRPRSNPVSESAPLRPTSPYGVVKLAAESLSESLGRASGVEVVTLRPFSVYGDRSPARSVVGRLVRLAAAGGDLVVADLEPVRDYVHVTDLAGAVVAACHGRLAGGAAVVNIASGVGSSVGDVARLVASLSGRRLAVRAAPGTSDRPAGTDTTELVGDISAARQILGWAPSTPIAEGLRSALDHVRRAGPGDG